MNDRNSKYKSTPTLEDDSPTLWRDMTDAEKGALLLAYHEGEVIEQWWCGRWLPTTLYWISNEAYRIKPSSDSYAVLEPKVKTTSFKWWIEDDISGLQTSKTYKISLALIEGKPDPTSIKMEEL